MSDVNSAEPTCPVPSDWLEVLCSPGGGDPLQPLGDGLVGADGTRFDFEQGILRTLGEVDPLLAAELHAQSQAVDEYLDPRLLMPRYESEFVVKVMLREFLGNLHALGKKRVLDAGCGVGLLGRTHPGLNLVGLDASSVLLKNATKGYSLRVEGSAEFLPFRDESFDVVVALNMLHHVIEPRNAVREFARVLRRGGVLIAVDPRKVWPIELAKSLLRSNDPAFAETHKSFSVDEYRELLTAEELFRIDRYERKGLIGLVGMAGFDATRLSHAIRDAELAVNVFAQIDNVVHRIPFVRDACLNLAVRAVRS